MRKNNQAEDGPEARTWNPAGKLLELNGQDINLLAIGLIYRL